MADPTRARWTGRLLCALAGGALLAFGGVHLRTMILLATTIAVVVAAVRPSIARGAPRALDVWLLLFVACAALQIVPLPASIAGAISPASVRLQRDLSLEPPPFATLSIRPSDTAHALLVLVTALAVFWTARERFRTGGVRSAARAIAILGFLVSLVALAQSATARGAIYWRWRPLYEGPEPFGPFVNRNHFATWALLVIPLCLGYLAARSKRRETANPGAPLAGRIARSIDARSLWLFAAGVVTAAALIATLSRSGIAALAAALAGGWLLTRPRAGRMRRRVVVALPLAALSALAFWHAPALAGRFGQIWVGYANRLVIWRETMPIVRDFWTAGAGLGTFERTMTFYQQAERSVFFNQAHSEYLQLAAEGGLLLLLPAAGAASAFLRLAAARLRADGTGMFWIRAGAAAGLAAVLFQSIWENGLRMPANAILTAIVAAIVVHEPHRHHQTPRS